MCGTEIANNAFVEKWLNMILELMHVKLEIFDFPVACP